MPRVLQGVSSDSKNRNESILQTTTFPSSFPLPSTSSLLSHLMKCCGKKSQFLVIACGLSDSRLLRCQDWCGRFVSPHLPASPSPHHLPCLLCAPGASAGRGGEQRHPSSSPMLTFAPSLPRPSWKDPLVSPPLPGPPRSCLSHLHALSPPPSGQEHKGSCIGP